MLQNITGSVNNTFKRKPGELGYRTAGPEMSFHNNDEENRSPGMNMKNNSKESG